MKRFFTHQFPTTRCGFPDLDARTRMPIGEPSSIGDEGLGEGTDSRNVDPTTGWRQLPPLLSFCGDRAHRQCAASAIAYALLHCRWR